MQRLPSLPVLTALVGALAAIAVAAMIAWYQIDRGPTGADGRVTAYTPNIDLGGPYELVDHTGRTVTDADFNDSYLLIYFGYTYCPDFCPTELQNMTLALADLGRDAAKVTPVFITVDPDRDTVDAVADYVSHFDPRFVGLTGSADQIAEAAKQFRVYYAKAEDDSSTEYLMDHSTFVYLVGTDGKVVTIFPYGTEPDQMAVVIRAYLDKQI